MYQAEYESLKENIVLRNKGAFLKLDPYYDKRDRLLRVGRRLQYSDILEGTKHPIILPHGHPVVEKTIQSVHEELVHAGQESTLSVLREEIWLTKGRREVKRVLEKCLVCQRQRARRPMFTKDGAITIGEGVIVSSLHSRRNRLCGAVVCMRESHHRRLTFAFSLAPLLA